MSQNQKVMEPWIRLNREAGASLRPGEGGGYHILEHKSRHRTQDDKREKGETDG